MSIPVEVLAAVNPACNETIREQGSGQKEQRNWLLSGQQGEHLMWQCVKKWRS